MKRIGGLLLLALLGCSAFAQQDSIGAVPKPVRMKSWEVGLSGSYVYLSQGSSNGSGVFTVAPRIGYFIWQGLELESELYLIAPSGGDPYYAVNGNLSYNLPLQKQALVFVLAGYGLGNLVPLGSIGGTGYPSTTLGLFNAGGGVKIKPADNVAFRVEFRYMKVAGDYTLSTYGPVPASRKIDIRVLSVMLGMSFFFGS
jgi:hypothetical protein